MYSKDIGYWIVDACFCQIIHFNRVIFNNIIIKYLHICHISCYRLDSIFYTSCFLVIVFNLCPSLSCWDCHWDISHPKKYKYEWFKFSRSIFSHSFDVNIWRGGCACVNIVRVYVCVCISLLRGVISAPNEHLWLTANERLVSTSFTPSSGSLIIFCSFKSLLLPLLLNQ